MNSKTNQLNLKSLSKKSFLVLTLIFITSISFSQTEKQVAIPKVEASYEGGSEALNKFIATNVKYPKNSKTEGKVYVEFMVSEKGEIKDAKVLKSLSKELDEVALNAVNKMPKWKPATDDKGNPIASKMILPISFKK
jgi:TonB family protein